MERLKSGQSYREIAAEFGKSHNLIYKIKLRNNLEVSKPKKGRKKTFTARDRRTIARLIASGESKTAKDVTNLTNNSYGTHASVRTVNMLSNDVALRFITEQDSSPFLHIPVNMRCSKQESFLLVF